jgi:hypothetical protein
VKKCFVLLLWVAVCLLPPAAFADSESKPKAPKDAATIVVGGGTIQVTPNVKVEVQQSGAERKPNHEKHGAPGIKVETMSVGKVIMLGPDGKVEIKDIGAGIPKEVLDKLPKDLRDQIMKGPAAVGKNGVRAAGKMKIVVENNGKRQEYEADLGGGGVAIKQLPSAVIDDILKTAGDDLPAEIKEKLQATSQAIKAAEHQKAHGQTGQDAIGAKLDKILDRLERVENDVKALKARTEEPK